ncbi:hypothetical protein ACLRGF_07050 [Mycetocola zhadangensis]|uniref:DUF7715 family protein n=1 Tax=Mycetocola zhadangensis TaxID=1164595 RepID=UPI003A4D5067
MKVLVAPPVVELDDGTVNSFAIEGELVLDPGPCSCDGTDCVGGFSFIGVASGRLTTQAVIVDLPFLDIHDFREIVRSGCCRDCARDGYADEMVQDSRFTADRWPVGSIIGRSGGFAFLQRLGPGY